MGQPVYLSDVILQSRNLFDRYCKSLMFDSLVAVISTYALVASRRLLSRRGDVRLVMGRG